MIAQTGFLLRLVPKRASSRLMSVAALFSVGFVASAFAFLVRAMIADVSDEVRLETGKDRTAMLYAMVTSTNKVGSTLSVGIAYLILPLFGFVAKEGAVNTAEVPMWGLQACYLIPPVACVLLGGLAMFGYKLDEKRHARDPRGAAHQGAGDAQSRRSKAGGPIEGRGAEPHRRISARAGAGRC